MLSVRQRQSRLLDDFQVRELPIHPHRTDVCVYVYVCGNQSVNSSLSFGGLRVMVMVVSSNSSKKSPLLRTETETERRQKSPNFIHFIGVECG